jgi:SAM-dependent methyltransferase
MTHDYLHGSIGGERQLWTDLNAWMHMQALQWEPAGRDLLAELGEGTGLVAADMGCGPLGWLRLLSQWVGPSGEVVGTDAAEAVAEQARLTVRSEGLGNVSIVIDDVLDSALPDRSFDLVHARFMLAAVGQPEVQLATYRRLLKPGGWLVLEEPDNASLRFNPSAPANERLADLAAAFLHGLGRDFDAGRQVPSLLQAGGEVTELRARVLVLPPRHVYRAIILVGASAIRDSLAGRVGAEEVDRLLALAEAELDDPELWCTSFMLIQGCARTT